MGALSVDADNRWVFSSKAFWILIDRAHEIGKARRVGGPVLDALEVGHAVQGLSIEELDPQVAEAVVGLVADAAEQLMSELSSKGPLSEWDISFSTLLGEILGGVRQSARYRAGHASGAD
jgi:hypothetical protein